MRGNKTKNECLSSVPSSVTGIKKPPLKYRSITKLKTNTVRINREGGEASGAQIPQTLGSGFGEAKVDHLCTFLDKKPPLCKDEWELIFNDHNKSFSLHNRTVDVFRRKFAALHIKRNPNGDPSMPEDVRRAKHVTQKMMDRPEMGANDSGGADSLSSIDEQEDAP